MIQASLDVSDEPAEARRGLRIGRWRLHKGAKMAARAAVRGRGAILALTCGPVPVTDSPR